MQTSTREAKTLEKEQELQNEITELKAKLQKQASLAKKAQEAEEAKTAFEQKLADEISAKVEALRLKDEAVKAQTKAEGERDRAVASATAMQAARDDALAAKAEALKAEQKAVQKKDWLSRDKPRLSAVVINTTRNMESEKRKNYLVRAAIGNRKIKLCFRQLLVSNSERASVD